MYSAAQLWLIPALPLAAAGIAALAPRGARRLAAGTAILAMAGAFVLSCLALAEALRDPGLHATANFVWFDLGETSLQLGWLLDPLTAFMSVMVTLVGLLIFIFSTSYMKEDGRFSAFFCFLSFFAAAMLGLIVANSLLLLFICWELVGVASYLLIGFWFQKPSAAAAARKAFITTRIGDLGFLIGMVWMQHEQGTLLFHDGGNGVLEAAALSDLTQLLPGGLALSTAIGLLIFCGAAGKSGQFPLHVWLPDAMEGPTPVSALIHAATMVAAGVFLIARLFPLMSADAAVAGATLNALTVVAFIGAFTALLGAAIAVGQHDIKRILAFSTVSQLGYMMLALGVGAWTAAIFHLLAHAFFKALLFLGAGSVIHAAHHEQDIRKLGGLRTSMRVTFATFAIGMMALAGVPFLFSGFWSKEAILHAAQAWDRSTLPFAIALVAVVLTAFYNTRLVAEVFLGKARSEHAAHARENPVVMTIPLVLLAIGSVLIGFIGTPAYPWLQSKLKGENAVASGALFDGPGLMLLSSLLVAVGIGIGWALYLRRARISPTAADPLEQQASRIFRALEKRLWIDELYAATLGRLNAAAASGADWLDRNIWDGAVRAAAALSRMLGLTNRHADEKVLNRSFDGASAGLRKTGTLYSRMQSGDPRSYLRAVVVGFVVLILVVVMGGSR